jgi:hypothetical protein
LLLRKSTRAADQNCQHSDNRQTHDVPPKDQSLDTTGVKKTRPKGYLRDGKSLKCGIKCSGLSRELSGQNSSTLFAPMAGDFRRDADLETGGGAEMPLVQEGAIRAACPHDQADPRA